MTVIFYLVAIFFFALLIGFAGKVIIGGLMGAKPEMFRFARKGSIGNQLFNTIYLVFISLLVSIPLSRHFLPFRPSLWACSDTWYSSYSSEWERA